MSLTRTSGPVVDLALDEARTEIAGETGDPTGTRWLGIGFEAVCVRANGAIVLGALCHVTNLSHDAVEVTTAIIAALTAQQKTAALLGMAQALATDNQLLWVVTKKTDANDTTIVALAGAAITANAQINSTTTDGEIDDDGTSAAWILEGIEVETDPASGIVFSTVSWPVGITINPTVIP